MGTDEAKARHVHVVGGLTTLHTTLGCKCGWVECCIREVETCEKGQSCEKRGCVMWHWGMWRLRLCCSRVCIRARSDSDMISRIQALAIPVTFEEDLWIASSI